MKKLIFVIQIFMWLVFSCMSVYMAAALYPPEEYFVYYLGCIISSWCTLSWNHTNNIIGSDIERSSYNPLYVRGYIRKNAEKSNFCSFFIGTFCCQIVTIIFWTCIWISIILCQFTDVDYTKKVTFFSVPIVHFPDIMLRIPTFFYLKIIFHSIGILSWVFIFIRLMLNCYYERQYSKDFRYIENSQGIWRPFAYVAQPHGFGYYRPFNCQYYVPKEEIRGNLRKACSENGYRYAEKVEEGEEYTDIYLRKKRRTADLSAGPYEGIFCSKYGKTESYFFRVLETAD